MADQQNACSMCGMSFPSEEQLKRHAQEQHNACTMCGMSFQSKEQLQSHAQEQHRPS